MPHVGNWSNFILIFWQDSMISPSFDYTNQYPDINTVLQTLYQPQNINIWAKSDLFIVTNFPVYGCTCLLLPKNQILDCACMWHHFWPDYEKSLWSDWLSDFCNWVMHAHFNISSFYLISYAEEFQNGGHIECWFETFQRLPFLQNAMEMSDIIGINSEYWSLLWVKISAFNSPCK